MCDTDFESCLMDRDLEGPLLDCMPDYLKLWNYYELLAKKQREGLNADETHRLALLTAKTAFLREEAEAYTESVLFGMSPILAHA